MEKEEDEEEDLFIEWPAEEGQQESAEDEDEDEEKDMETERKSGLSFSRLRVSPDNRRASLPCLAQLSTMHLTHLTQLTHVHTATIAPSPVSMRHRLKGGEARKVPLYQHDQNQDAENVPKPAPSSAVPNVLTVPEKRGRFRSRNVISLCIELWLWMKQTCPMCHKHMAVPEPLYWTSAHLKVP
ncbi:uncharacterized protein si:ch211-207l14.1 isoform X1 [Hemibagrus wyckioides]|uniref:uncharacterized protein si:ch211-207l14.1 isoform X1 n=1 Tax=Hemibagrus wyckioides TaxID=337641 RepID=UPI00266BBD09|nr:uncharacterized protein si:ch211-207l14.1 isoform X1 [Hemibagrus wyckioides]